MSNNKSSKVHAYMLFFTESVTEIITEIMNMGPKAEQIILESDEDYKIRDDSDTTFITRYLCLCDINIVLSRFSLDTLNGSGDTFDKFEEYYDKFTSLNPSDVLKISKQDNKIYKMVDPLIYNDIFNYYQQKLINLEKSIREGGNNYE